MRHLDAVAEHSIETDPQTRDPGPRSLPLLEPGDPRPRLARVADDRGELGVPALADHAAVVEREGRLVLERRRQELVQVVERRQLAGRLGDRGSRERGREAPDVLQRRQAAAKADQVAGVGLAERRAAGQPLEVADPT